MTATLHTTLNISKAYFLVEFYLKKFYELSWSDIQGRWNIIAVELLGGNRECWKHDFSSFEVNRYFQQGYIFEFSLRGEGGICKYEHWGKIS